MGKGIMLQDQKNIVSMDLCFFCGEPKGIIISRNLNKELPLQAVYNKEPCENCKKLMKKGVMFIEVKDGESGDNPFRTGRMVVVKEEAFKTMPIPEHLREDILKSRMTYIEVSIFEGIGLDTIFKKKNAKTKRNTRKSKKSSI